jgi:purine-binding chemotaxis protein CheW
MTISILDAATEALLKRRAEQLAHQNVADEAATHIEVLVCRVGSELYAMETAYLRSVQWAGGITPVPCTPPFVLGIVSVRGDIVTVLDLGTMLGLKAAPESAETYALLLLGLPGVRAGLVVDEIVGVEHFGLDTLQPSLSGREFTRGIAPGPTVLLDLEQLFTSGRFDVLDELF